MIYDEFRVQRLEELKKEDRVLGGGHSEYPGLNDVAGLIELVKYAKPPSVLEVGSCRGVSTEVFLIHSTRVVAVDSWDKNWEPLYYEFMARIGTYPHLEVVHEASPEALGRFKDDEFDLVYVDGAHDYNSVKWDIIAAKRIAKNWIAGHDYIPGSDVAIAVHELLGEPQVFSDTSWLIKK